MNNVTLCVIISMVKDLIFGYYPSGHPLTSLHYFNNVCPKLFFQRAFKYLDP